MAYTLTARASGASDLTAKNRVWDFFDSPNKTRPANRRQPLQLRRKNRPTTTKPASGIPYWPSRDPIGEVGGANLYGFVGNDGLNRWDYLGLAIVIPPGGGPTVVGKCCCISKPEKCSIKVTWTKKGVAKAGIPKNGKPGEIGFGSQVFAKVDLIHADGKDVSGCTIHQGAKTEIPAINYKKEKPNDIVVSPPHFEDKPTIELNFIPASNNGSISGHFRADVFIEQAPQVKTIWGYQVEMKWNFPNNILSATINKTVPEGGN